MFSYRLLFFSREATSETYGHQVSFHYICLQDLFLFAFIFISTDPKTPKYLAGFCFLLFASINLLQFYLVNLTISGTVTRKGLTTPLTRRVASICPCASTVYVVLLGSPTGSITLVSSLREMPTIAVLHHPFLFREILT